MYACVRPDRGTTIRMFRGSATAVQRSLLALTVTATVLAGCVTTPAATPRDRVALAEQALLAARRAHVEDYAAPTLRKARREYQGARRALAAGHGQDAADLAQISSLYSRLALLQARIARARANRLQLERRPAEPGSTAAPPGIPR